MRLVPYDSFVIESPRPLPEVVEAVRKQIQAPVGFVWRWPRRHKLFSGSADASGFTLKPISRGWGDFRPVIRGRFEEQGATTLVRVRIALSALHICYLVGWCCLVGLMTTNLALRGELSWPWACVTFGGLALFGLLVMWLRFRHDAKRARRGLDIALGVPPPSTGDPGHDTSVEEGN